MPLLRVPFIKYWLALLDLATGDRSREAMGRVMSSAYFDPRLSPRIDIERILAGIGYIDRHHLPPSALAARKNSALTAEFQRFEKWLDELGRSNDSVLSYLARVVTAADLTERDRQAWRAQIDHFKTTRRVVAWVSRGVLQPTSNDFAMLRLVLLALLPQIGGILLLVGRRA